MARVCSGIRERFGRQNTAAHVPVFQDRHTGVPHGSLFFEHPLNRAGGNRAQLSLEQIENIHRWAALANPEQALCVAEAIDEDRKSTRLNSSHVSISYAVFCLKKKKKVC